MRPCVRLLFALLLCPVVLSILSGSVSAGDDWKEWKPVDPADLAMKSPAVEKDADAEALFWEIRVQDEFDVGGPRTVFRNYIRVKVFTERGKESESTVELVYYGRNKITDIAARTIHPDGSIVELKKDAVFDRDIVRQGDIKLKAKTFAMPSVEPGAIIEYRWREIRQDQLANYLQLQLQRDVPVRLVKYYVKPPQGSTVAMRALTMHAPGAQWNKEKDGFSSITMTNMPAFHEEPQMPPEDQVRAWILIFYSNDDPTDKEKFWKDLGKEVYKDEKSYMKVNDDVRRASAAAIGDASTPEAKLERLLDFCRSKIRNASDDASGLTDADRAKLKENNSPSDTLKRGIGTAYDISMLFAAMANAAGFDARFARVSDRGGIFFDMTSPPNRYFLRTYDIAVKVGDQWRFFDPGSRYVSSGTLSWREEGVLALVSDPKEPFFTRTPSSPPERSLETRTATLRLSPDGTLEGDARIEYAGQPGMVKKEANDDDSPQQREDNLKEMMTGRMSTAELSNIRIENVTDPVKPFVYEFHIRVPGYAQRTGKRLFLQPAFFQKGRDPLFPTSERRYPVYFHYSWSESDTVRIELPEGYVLDNPQAAAPFKVEGVGVYDVKIKSFDDGKAIEYTRKFLFGANDVLLFPQEGYPNLKRIFDTLHERDNSTLVLKQAPAQ
jgi:Domain of Unknown Function with PDB structure (DUF3857)/Transglutaminase-like superfamily